MSNEQTFKLVLTGAYAGKSKVLLGHVFKHGVCELHGTMENIQGVVDIMGKCYQAYLEGTKKLEEAQARDRKALGLEEGGDKSDGKHKVHAETESGGSTEVSNGIQQNGEAPSEEGANDGGSDDGSEEGNQGMVSEGDGSGPDGPSELEKIKETLMGLDPEDNSLWTTTGGLAQVAVVSAASGIATLQRSDIEEAYPGFDREVARANWADKEDETENETEDEEGDS